MYDNNYVDPFHGCTVLQGDQANVCSSGIMGMEENLQRQSVRLPNFSMGEVTQNNFSDETGIASDLQQQLNFELEHEYHSRLIQDVLQQQNNLHQDVCQGQQSSNSAATAASSWEASFNEMQDITLFHQQQSLLQPQDHISSFSAALNNAYTAPPELLNLLQIPKCSAASTNISFGSKKPLDIFPILSSEMGDQNSRLHDPQLSFAPQPPMLRDMFHTLPHNYQLNPPMKSYMGFDEKVEAALQEAEAGRQFTNSMLDLKRDMTLSKGEGRGANHFATERQRREYLNEKYQNLRNLVPNPTKADRASIVGDAIEYIKELLRTVGEMKTLVEEKRCGSGRNKRHKLNNNSHEFESCSPAPPLQASEQDQKYLTNGALRSSWLQRTSKDGTQVDVRIVDNEVNIKLIQRKRRSCLLCVSLILHELHLEILHANGANIGEHYIFMFNTKIYEGSCEYARSIATKLMDAVDRHMTYFPNF